ncbi:unnamed protein product [Coffea canephora]|uniref:F-box domain-containing protein n=2 Tax=Coffea TaxID=13442 RepID=A0A068UTJ5_COFCA|nr:putative F-box/FBD/LRR-repeat protein At4g03220 [Coffea arabica]CDP11865.1 unnamed protein product [Coffea canephora]
METRSAKRKKLLLNAISEKTPQGHEDRISDLPDAVIHHILFLLPIRSIAQTSILSKRWRQIWYTFPDLDFTSIGAVADAPVKNATDSKKLHSLLAKGAEFISQVLALRDHNKYSDLRVLRFRACLSFSRLNGLIRRAIRFNVQELDIEVTTNDFFNFPRSVVLSQSLRIFRLKSQYPGFRLPPVTILKGGFGSLLSLSLSRVILYDQPSLLNLFSGSSFPMLKKLSLEIFIGLKHLSVSCRGLEDLTLENCFQLEDLEICSPKLENLRIVGCFDAYSSSSWLKIDGPRIKMIFWSHNSIPANCSVENLISLHEAFVGFFVLHEDISAAKLRSVSNFLSGLSHSQSLILESPCIEILSKNYHFGGVFQYPFSRLISMELQTGFNTHNLPGLAGLFRNSPKVHTLIMKIDEVQNAERRKWNRDLWESSSSGEERFWESQSQAMNSFLHHLKVVKIHGFSECENDISLVKFFLKHGKVLQEMFLSSSLSKPGNSLEREKIKSQIMGFSRASSNAKIWFQ